MSRTLLCVSIMTTWKLSSSTANFEQIHFSHPSSKCTLQVDTNVGRICARLGWLPLDSEKALEVRFAVQTSLHCCRHYQCSTHCQDFASVRCEFVMQALDDYAPEPEVHAYLKDRFELLSIEPCQHFPTQVRCTRDG